MASGSGNPRTCNAFSAVIAPLKPPARIALWQTFPALSNPRVPDGSMDMVELLCNDPCVPSVSGRASPAFDGWDLDNLSRTRRGGQFANALQGGHANFVLLGRSDGDADAVGQAEEF